MLPCSIAGITLSTLTLTMEPRINRCIARNTLKRAPDRGKCKRPGSLPKKQLRAAQDEAYLE